MRGRWGGRWREGEKSDETTRRRSDETVKRREDEGTLREKGVAILGLGLMGTSLALALRERCEGVRIAGYNHSPGNARTALERGAVDAVASSPAEAVAGASMVVLAAPVLANIGFADAIAGALAEGQEL